MPRKESAAAAQRRPLTEADRMLIDSIRAAEAAIRKQELVVQDLGRKLGAERRRLREMFSDLRQCAAPGENALFEDVEN